MKGPGASRKADKEGATGEAGEIQRVQRPGSHKNAGQQGQRVLPVANELSTERAENWPLGLAPKPAVVMVRGAVWRGDSQSSPKRNRRREIHNREHGK